MEKKIVMIAAMAVLAVSMATSAFAVVPKNQAVLAPDYSLCVGGYGIMWGQDGNFLGREAFETNLDKLI